MPLLYFIGYVAVEIAALAWLASAVGILWTILIVIGASALGLVMVRSQGRRVLAEFRLVNSGKREPGGAIADGVFVAIGSILMVVPGLVSSLVGLLLLIPLTRSVLRPIVSAVAVRRYGRAVAKSGFGPTAGAAGPRTAAPGQFRGSPGSFDAGHVVIDADTSSENPTGRRP